MNKYNKRTLVDNWIPLFRGMTTKYQKTHLWASSLNNSGSEFPSVTEQTSLVSEVLGRAPSGSFRSIISTLASTFIGDGLSTSIISPTDSSATLPSDYQSSTESANLSSIKKALIAEGSFGLGEQNLPVPNKRLHFTTKLPVLSSIWRRVGDLHSSPAFTGPHYLLGTAPTSGVNPPPQPAYQKLNRITTILKFGFVWILGFVIWNLLTPSPAFATNTGVFTMELWVKPTSSVASQALVGKSEELRIFTDASGNPGCQIKTTSWQTAVTSSTAISLNTWSHVACFYDKTNIKIYVNGVQTGSQALTTVPDDTANTFKIGQDDSASTPYSNLTGVVDQFQFYNYARSAKQIVQDMNAGHPSVGSPVGSAVGYWKFDEGQGTTAYNSGSQGETLQGSLSGFASPATSTSGWTQAGKFGRALVFDGTDDYVDAGTNTSLNPTASGYTITAWFKLTNLNDGQYRRIAGRNGAAVSSALINVTLQKLNTNELRIGARDSSDNLVTATTTNTLSTGIWYFGAGTFDGINKQWTIYLYNSNGFIEKVTGAANSSLTVSDLNTGGQSFYIGKAIANDGSTLVWDGSIDEVKVYNYALTADEVKMDYNRSSSLVMGSLSDNSTYQVNAANQEYCVPGDSTSCTAPVARWDFEEGSGTSAFDKSGNANTGTLTNATWTSGKYGKAVNLDGNGDIVSIANESNFDFLSSGFTLEAWVYSSTLGSQTAEVISKYASSDKGWEMFVNSGKLNLAVYGTGGGYIGRSYNTALSNNTWTHVVATYNGGTTSSAIDLYVNGVLLDDTDNNSGTFTAIRNSTSTVAIGATSETNAVFTGKIDDARVYNYVRSAAQIAWDYNKGAPIGHWKMDECQGPAVQDSSGNGNTGTITIGASGENTIGTCNTSSTAWGSGATGKRNASLSFDGTDDYVSMGNVSILGFNKTDSFTISNWVKTSSTTGYPSMIGKRGAGNGFYITYLSNDSNYGPVGGAGLRLTDTNDNTAEVRGSVNVADGNWHHVVVTYDGSSTASGIKIYTDGFLNTNNNVTANTLTGNLTNSANFQVAAFNGTSQPLNGQVDEVKIFNYALTATQVKNEYNGGSVRFGPSTGSP